MPENIGERTISPGTGLRVEYKREKITALCTSTLQNQL